jgi:hypothetical protein
MNFRETRPDWPAGKRFVGSPQSFSKIRLVSSLDFCGSFFTGEIKIRSDAYEIDQNSDYVPNDHRSRGNQQAIENPENLKETHNCRHAWVHACCGPTLQHCDQIWKRGKRRSKSGHQADDLRPLHVWIKQARSVMWSKVRTAPQDCQVREKNRQCCYVEAFHTSSYALSLCPLFFAKPRRNGLRRVAPLNPPPEIHANTLLRRFLPDMRAILICLMRALVLSQIPGEIGRQRCRTIWACTKSHKCEGRTCSRIIRTHAATKSALSCTSLPSGSSVTSSNPVRIPWPRSRARLLTAQHAIP